MPFIEEWIEDLLQSHRCGSAPARSVVPFGGDAWFDAAILDAARVAFVDRIPFPPVSDYGLPEFEAMAAMPMAGITFRNMYFLDAAQATDGIHFHELVHIIQWQTLRPREFLYSYALSLVQSGYIESPFEAIAFELQRRFESGTAPGAVGPEVVTQAIGSRDVAFDVYRRHGVDWGQPE